MKKIYNRPCVDVLLFTTSSTILYASPGDTDGDGKSDIVVDAGGEGTDNEEYTGGYREWGNIWGN